MPASDPDSHSPNEVTNGSQKETARSSSSPPLKNRLYTPEPGELVAASDEINLEYEEGVAQGTYANSVRITSSSEEFVLDFIRMVPGAEQARVKSRVIVTPQHAKRLLDALDENLESTEIDTVERPSADPSTPDLAQPASSTGSDDSPPAVSSIEPELLVATFSASADPQYCNSPWRRLLGPTANPWTHLSDTDRKLVESAVEEACDGSLVTNQLISVSTSDREEPLPLLLNFIPMYDGPQDGDRDVRGATVSGEVLAEPPSWMVSQTQRQRIENLGRMTMGVAHDLNNLLSGLIGHIELLKQQIDRASLTDSIQPSIEMIETTAEDGAALIDKLQRYIRHDTQQHFEPVNVPDLIDECITLTEPYWYNEARREGIEISVETDLADVPNILGSPSELREVFVNLILNAVQAMPDGGTLRFEASETEDEHVCIKVIDTGVGMSDEVQKNIFEPLYTTKGDQGTGMGLSASYGIIQEHEGSIDVSSAPGEGTAFTLTFPSTDAAPTPPAESPEAPEKAGSASVLVVDDEEMVRSTVNRLLSLNGHDVDLASSGAEALQLFSENDYDIVFTDFGMPEMTGAAIARKLNEMNPDLPVILLTGYTEPETDAEVVDDVLSKPFKGDELESVIQKHVPEAT